MRVKALTGLTFDEEGLRVEAGEEADLPAPLAETWAAQGIVELIDDTYSPPADEAEFDDLNEELLAEWVEDEDEEDEDEDEE